MYDGCVYLCGYVVEFALKARICRFLNLNEYPETGDLGRIFKTHDFDILKVLAGLQDEISITKNARLFQNWSTATQWKPEQRYSPVGTYSELDAKGRLASVKEQTNGVLAWLTKRW
jgi:hypothetical protein